MKALHAMRVGEPPAFKRSLRFKIIVGFLAVILAFLVFLIGNNFYTIHVVQAKVSDSYENLVEYRAQQIEDSLQAADHYLLRLATSDSSYEYLIDLSLYPQDSGDYFLSVQWLIRKFQEDLSAYASIEDFFVYSVSNDDLEPGKRAYDDVQKDNGLLRPYLKNLKNVRNIDQSWKIVSHEDQTYLVRLVKVNDDVYLGALVDIHELIAPFAQLNLARSGNTVLFDQGGNVLAELSDEQQGDDKRAAPPSLFGGKNAGYLLIDVPIAGTPLILAVTIPKQTLLHEWLYFQRLMYLIPVAGFFLIFFYWTYLKQIVQKPMNRMIRAMRKVMQGNLDVYLPDDSSMEISFVNETFNNMVVQIKKLRIDIYEETLRKKELEMKQLQAQIQPHFYLNSLNIISSLASLDQKELVKKMAEHLADYFRFIMQSNRALITLEEELDHIRSYLEIQKLRFPRKFDYAIRVDPELQACTLMPLIIQPFVENAVIHGMGMGKNRFTIDISVRTADEAEGLLDIRIEDNGRGFPEPLLAILQSGAYDRLDERRHHGIRNVLQRLELLGRESTRVSFANREERGACVRLVIPERREEAAIGG